MNLALIAISAATLSLDYHLDESAGELRIAWSGPAASGKVSKRLTRADRAALANLALAVASPDSGDRWQPLAIRAAELLLGGIEPLSGVRQLAITTPPGPLRGIPFEVLGRPALIERFTVWYEPSAAGAVNRLWSVPEDVAARFMGRYEAEVQAGLGRAEALRRVKIERLHAGEHPFYWAGFVPHGDGAAVTSTRVIPWLWIAALSLLGASAAFYAWWRKQRYELL